jgi:hypothetical protein
VGEILRIDQPDNRLVQGDAGRKEDREHDGETRKLLGSRAPEEEGDAERNRRQGVASVVDEIGQ